MQQVELILLFDWFGLKGLKFWGGGGGQAARQVGGGKPLRGHKLGRQTSGEGPSSLKVIFRFVVYFKANL